MTSFLYIGQYTEGTTSKMRANKLIKILDPEQFEVIDTHIPFYQTNKVFRSFGFRYKRGPLIGTINNYIQKRIEEASHYDLIWVDKGVFINNKTITILKQRSEKLVHFTPDPAFTFHKSHLFNSTIDFYDYLITTKSFEIEHYHKVKDKSQVLYVTQGFDKEIHKKGSILFKEKSGVVFLGHYEKERAEVIEKLIKNNIDVTLAGIKWEDFASRFATNKNLNYLGSGVYGKDYVKAIQNAKIAWGAISKWIPELHTTRTFEIPACGTALLTETNQEISSFFKPNEAVFYEDLDDLIQKLKFYLENDSELEVLTHMGYENVHRNGYDYESILRKVLKTILS